MLVPLYSSSFYKSKNINQRIDFFEISLLYILKISSKNFWKILRRNLDLRTVVRRGPNLNSFSRVLRVLINRVALDLANQLENSTNQRLTDPDSILHAFLKLLLFIVSFSFNWQTTTTIRFEVKKDRGIYRIC